MWHPLSIWDTEPCMSEAGEKIREKINVDVSAIIAERDQIDAAERERDATPPADLTPEKLALFGKIPARRAECLRRELELRIHLGAKWFPALAEARTKRLDLAQQAVDQKPQELVNKVVAALVKMGFPQDVEVAWRTVNSHPSIPAAVAELDVAKVGPFQCRAARNANLSTIETLSAEIKSFAGSGAALAAR